MADPKQPPHAIESEQSVLGALLLDNRVYDELLDRLKPGDFYRADHQLIFAAIMDLISRGVPCDFVTLSEHLRGKKQLDEAGGLSYLGSLAADTPSAHNVRAYAAIVAERSIFRKLIAAGQDISDLGFKPDGRKPHELLAEASIALMKAEMDPAEDVKPIGDYADEYYDALCERRDRGTQGMSFGFRVLDEATGGMEDGDLVVIQARSGMGKTVLAVNVAEQVASGTGYAVAVFSMEMPRKQLMARVLSSRESIPGHLLKYPRGLTQEQMDRLAVASGQLRDLPMYIDDRPALTLQQLAARARVMKRKALIAGKVLKLVVVDYIQLMQGSGKSGQNRTNELGDISAGLKSLAKELGLTVIALAQTGRQVDDRDNKRPQRRDLRECGNIEMDCDILIALYNDERYDKDSPHKGIIEADIQKQRNGKEIVVELSFEGEYSRFSTYHGPDKKQRAAAAAPPDVKKEPKQGGLGGSRRKPKPEQGFHPEPPRTAPPPPDEGYGPLPGID